MFVTTKNDVTFCLTETDVTDIVCSAFNGGISYWCTYAEVVGDQRGSTWEQQIALGGSILLKYEDGQDTLNLDKFLTGLTLYLSEFELDLSEFEKKEDGSYVFDFDIDAVSADLIIQYALFGEQVYA